MTYQYIPNPNDKLSKSQADIKSDFTLLDTTLGKNHFPATATSNVGKHKFVEMPILAVKPTIAALEGGLYTKTSGQSQLFYTSDTPGQEYQLTRAIDASIATFATSTGWTFLPGGLIMQWGQATSSGTALPNTTVNFTPAFTNPVYSVNCTILTTSDNRFFVEIYDLANNQFRAVTRDGGGSKTSGITFCWIAIGK